MAGSNVYADICRQPQNSPANVQLCHRHGSNFMPGTGVRSPASCSTPRRRPHYTKACSAIFVCVCHMRSLFGITTAAREDRRISSVMTRNGPIKLSVERINSNECLRYIAEYYYAPGDVAKYCDCPCFCCLIYSYLCVSV